MNQQNLRETIEDTAFDRTEGQHNHAQKSKNDERIRLGGKGLFLPKAGKTWLNQIESLRLSSHYHVAKISDDAQNQIEAV